MNSSSEPVPSITSSPSGKSHTVLLVVALALTVMIASVAGWYALQIGSLLLIAHAAESSLVAVAVWAALDAAHIRHLLKEAATGNPLSGPPEKEEKHRQKRLRQALEAKSLHIIYLAVPTAAIAFFTIFQTWRLGFSSTSGLSIGVQTALGLMAISTSLVWLILSKTLSSISEQEIREAVGLSRGFRELQWSAWIVAGSMFLAIPVPALGVWAGRVLSLWLISLCLEQLTKASWVWVTSPSQPNMGIANGDVTYKSPTNLLLREAFLVRGNPVASLFDVLEQRFGVNFRASWAIAFVRTITPPLLGLLILFGWLMTAFQVVEPHQFAVVERLGHTEPQPITPGLHVVLPWPLSQVRRFPVKTISTMQIGFKDSSQATKASQPLDPDAPRALLWTQAHDEEFAMVLGNGTEVVAINAIVLFKIHEDAARFFDYVYLSQNPETALETLAYRTLLELTRSATLNDVLTTDRAGFASRFRETLRDYAEQQRLGIDVIDVAVINLHPPVDAAADYLDVISAQVDATRVELEATGFRSARLLTAESESLGLVAAAKIESARRVSQADAESSEFLAAEEARALAPQSYSLRLWIEVLEYCLKGKRLFLVDKTLLENSDHTWLDLRPTSSASQMEGIPHGK